MKTTFLILHGYGGSAHGHWQSLLADHLKEAGASVLYPSLPNPDQPRREKWLAFLGKTLKDVDPNTLVVISHSLGCSLWIHYANRHPGISPRRVFLVAPPLNDCGIEEIKDFFPLPSPHLGDRAEIIGSDNDPHIPKREFDELANQLKVPFRLIPNAGHITVSAGYGDWDWMNQECAKYIV